MRSIKIKFALDENNRIVLPTDVANGKNCRCTCIECGDPLIAAQGNQRIHHFRHAKDCDCTGGCESAMHRAAKQIICEKKYLLLPTLDAKVSGKDKKGQVIEKSKPIIRDDTVMKFESIETEAQVGTIRADLLASKSKQRLIIEIYCSHAVDEEKLEKIKATNVSAIEIDLSDLTWKDIQNWDEFWDLLNDPQRISWLHNTKNEAAEQELLTELKQEITKQNKREKSELISALHKLKKLRSKEHCEHLKINTFKHQVWEKIRDDIPLDGNEFPEYLNLKVPDGDWIFGCDRSIWQSAVFQFLFAKPKKTVCTNLIDRYLQITLNLKVPALATTLESLGRKYSELIPSELANDFPSSWRTLNSYFEHLSKLNLLVYTRRGEYFKGNNWYEVVSEDPLGVLSKPAFITIKR